MQKMIGLGLGALLLAVGSLGADEKEAKFDAAKMVGDWNYVSGVKHGEKVDADHLKNKVVITKDTLTLTGDMKFVMKYELDAKKNPVGIKLEMTESPFGAGAKAVGIISLNGDELKLCYDPEGKKAPDKFVSTDDNKAHLFILKRAK